MPTEKDPNEEEIVEEEPVVVQNIEADVVEATQTLGGALVEGLEESLKPKPDLSVEKPTEEEVKALEEVLTQATDARKEA